MGYRHAKDDILDGAIAAAFDDGLSRLTFGRLAKRLGISDRVIVYYFPTKDDLVGEVLLALGAQLRTALATTFSSSPIDHRALLRTTWPTLGRPEFDPVFALFFEAAGLAAAGREPYRTVVPQLVDGWIAWAADLLGGTPAERRREAVAAIAAVDGLLLLRQLAGPEAADLAAERIGMAGTSPQG
jgi:AcrR family transcriptional regulator